MNKTQKNLVLVLERIINTVKNDEEAAQIYADDMELLLDWLKDDDFFGTEGQTDPRGDYRNAMWAINGVVEQ